MFTGIIQAIGKVNLLERRGGDLRVSIHAPDLDWADVELGDSIAANGVCLTAVELGGESYTADVSTETIEHTSIAHWKKGDVVNLEKALTPSSRLGGHIVSGHVDGVGDVIERHVDARSERFSIQAPKTLAKYIAHKGSITVDGISLTVNAVNGDIFELNIVPHTLKHTIMNAYKVGTKINLEVDVIARYLERLLLGDKAAEQSADHTSMTSTLNTQFLADNGYLK